MEKHAVGAFPCTRMAACPARRQQAKGLDVRTCTMSHEAGAPPPGLRYGGPRPAGWCVQDNTDVFVNNIQSLQSMVEKYVAAIDQQVRGPHPPTHPRQRRHGEGQHCQ